MKSVKRNPLLHPFLLGLYPVLALLAGNITEVKAADGLRGLAAAVALAALLLLAANLLLRERVKASLVASLFLVLFFSYGHFYLFVKTVPLLAGLARIRYLLPLFGGVFLLGCWRVLRARGDLRKLTYTVNAAAAVAVLIPLFQLGSYQIRTWLAQARSTVPVTGAQWALPAGDPPPDIYYIVLDGYSRGDALKQHLNFDNGEFLAALEELGFYVADCSQANYSWTLPSLASTFNMTYLNGGSGEPRLALDDDTLYSMVRGGEVAEALDALGYTLVSFETGFEWLEWYQADVYLASVGSQEGSLRLGGGLNEFELMLLETTGARLLLDARVLFGNDSPGGLTHPRERQRQRVLYALHTLPEIPRTVSGPRFVYAHIVSPHHPFIFGPNGEWLTNPPTDEVRGYLDQVSYVNSRMLDVLRGIIANSERPPLIVLQGDHGAPLKWREALGADPATKLAILNAYYLPGVEAGEYLYPSISPVNTFRLIFDLYFGGDFGLLEDKSILGRASPPVQLECVPQEPPA